MSARGVPAVDMTPDIPVPTWLVVAVLVAWVAVGICQMISSAIASRTENREADARAAEAAVVALHAGEITELHAELQTLCAQARDHVAVLDAFRQGWDLTDDEINSAESLALLAAAANITPEAVQAEIRARHASDTPTTALPTVPSAGDPTSGKA